MIWIAFVIFEIFRNYLLIEWLNLRPHYGYSAMIRLAAGATFLLWRHPEFDPVGAILYRDFNAILPATNYALFQWTSFYLLFDASLNALRGKPLDYQGKNSGRLDRLDKRKYYALKIASLVILILTLILI